MVYDLNTSKCKGMLLVVAVLFLVCSSAFGQTNEVSQLQISGTKRTKISFIEKLVTLKKGMELWRKNNAGRKYTRTLVNRKIRQAVGDDSLV